MKLIEIIKKVDWSDVSTALYSYYFEDPKECKNSEDYETLNIYKKIFNDLRNLKPQDCMGMRLYVEHIKGESGKGFNIEVIGRNGKLNKESEDFKFCGDNVSEEIANSEITYALDMVRWEEWLDMSVPLEVIKNFSMPEIVAHCIYGMTFLGFNQEQIQGKYNELKRRCENIKNSKAIDMEELKRIIEEMDLEEDNEDDIN